jgi:hypothetical protein
VRGHRGRLLGLHSSSLVLFSDSGQGIFNSQSLFTHLSDKQFDPLLEGLDSGKASSVTWQHRKMQISIHDSRLQCLRCLKLCWVLILHRSHPRIRSLVSPIVDVETNGRRGANSAYVGEYKARGSQVLSERVFIDHYINFLKTHFCCCTVNNQKHYDSG